MLGGLAGRAGAQSAEAEALFKDGVRLLAAGEVGKACEAFEASNRAEPRAGTQISLGQCREQNHQLASAWSAYEDALKRAKDPRKRAFAAQRVKELEARLSHLTVRVGDASRIAGLALTRNGQPFDAILWNRALPVDGGDYVIAGHAPGHDDWQTTAHVPVDGGQVTVDVPALPAAAAPEASVPAAAPHAAVAIEPHGLTPRRTLAIGVAGAGVVGVAVGAVLGVTANHKKDDAFALCPSLTASCASADRANATLEAGRRRALIADVTFGVSAAALITAGVLWLTGGAPAERVTIAPHVGDGATGVALGGWF
ncbi:MAG TPA: hypothetical protein VFP84_29475 [Kofleriaceae bacterium]|nr:hypothetical protein [Kofleriaceae bacterium]